MTTVHSMVVRSTADQTHLEYPSRRPSWLALQCFRTFLWQRFADDFIFSQLEIAEYERRRWPPTLEPAVPPNIFDF